MRRYIIHLLSLSAIATLAANSLQAQAFGPTGSSASAVNSQPRLNKLQVPGSHVRSIATKLSLQYHDLPNVKVSPDAQNEQLIVMAPEETQREIAAEVQRMLGTQTGGTLQPTGANLSGPLRTRLNYITWREFEDDLRKVAGDKVPVTTSRNGERASFHLTAAPLQNTTVEVDRRNNLVTVVAPEPAIAGWQQLLAAIDQLPVHTGEVTQWMRLENAEPAPIQRTLRLLRGLQSAPSSAAPPTAPNSYFRNAVFQQNVAPQEPGEVPQAGEAGMPEGGSGVIGDTQIQFVPELGTIIIRGAKRDVERVMEVISEIEEKARLTQPEIEIVQLIHADSNAVSTLLKQLYDDVLSARQGEVSITSLDAPNALLLIGRKEAIESLKELVVKIDQPVDEASGLRVFRLQHTSAIDAETAIRDFFTDRPGSGDDLRPGLGPRVRVLADYRTNSLVISAAPRDMVEVTRLINEIDVEQVASQSEIKVFTLRNAVATDLAPTLQAAISGEGDTGGDNNTTQPSSSLQIVKLDAEGNQVLNSGILANATITADGGANALVVRAPAGSMPLIAELIRQLDKSPDNASFVKVFTIENGDATQLTQALVSLFGDTAATLGTNVGAGNLAGLPPSTAGGESSLVPLRFSTDIRTNSIVASGSAEDLEVVESILLRLDSTGFAERITEVIWLRNNDAGLIAEAVTNYVNARRQGQISIQQYQQGLGPYDLIDRDIIAIPELNSNSLLLSVSPRLYEDVRRLIDQLDRRRPMVLIKVLIAEVELDDTFEIGGELGLQDSLQFDRGIVNAALPPSAPGFNFNSAGVPNINSLRPDTIASRGISTFGVGTTNPSIGYGGFVLNAASDSVSLLLRTLHDANRLQVLSRPQVMTLDNTEASVLVGRQVARIIDVINTINGTTVSTADIQVGLILNVRPRVGQDGLIIMDVNATRSDRAVGVGTPVPTGDGTTVLIEDILTTTAQSTVTAYSGQTVVFGGLIQKARGNFSRRVPYLADIPLLGYLFKYEQETERRTELLVVLTPMLVTGEQDLEYVKQTESSRMSWCLADVVEAHGDVGLSGGNGLWGPAVAKTIYPDLQPTIDHIIVDDRVISEHPYLNPQCAPTMVAPPSNYEGSIQYQDNSLPGSVLMEPNLEAQGGMIVPDLNHLPAPEVVPGPSGPRDMVDPLPFPNGQVVPSPANVPDFSSPGDGAANEPRASIRQTSLSMPTGVSDDGDTVQAKWMENVRAAGDVNESHVQQASPQSTLPKRLGSGSTTSDDASHGVAQQTKTNPANLGGSSLTSETVPSVRPTNPTISPRSWIR